MKAIASDLHSHKWTTFSSVDTDGVSSRLRIILNELWRAGQELLAAGGRDMILAGDIFHMRGSIEPEVFNPTHQMIKQMLKAGVRFHAIPGNHDLSGEDTSDIGNAMQTFGALDGFTVCTEVTHIEDLGLLMVPWIKNVADLMVVLEKWSQQLGTKRASTDVIMHAGIDGVLMNMPDHGLSATDLQALGFRRVFAGHYHNHKEVARGIYSIGATTHQTFSDIGTKAGFLLIDDETVQYRASHAPSFVEINENTDEADVPLIADGNYVRVTGLQLNDQEVNEVRDTLYKHGAKGVRIQVARVTQSQRTDASAMKGLTLDQSVDTFITKLNSPHAAMVKQRCQDILTDVRTVHEES